MIDLPLRGQTLKGNNGMNDKNCYTLAANYILMHNDGCRLVHGIPTLIAGNYAGKKYGHAWIEYGNVCYDVVVKQWIPKAVYYGIGKIEYTVSYSRSLAMQNLRETGHYGAWDEKIADAFHSNDIKGD